MLRMVPLPGKCRGGISGQGRRFRQKAGGRRHGAGDKVEAGQPLAVVEAMKMENILRAEKAGTVKSVNAKPGDSLAVDAVILEFE